MPKLVDLKGQRFGRLEVLRKSHTTKGGQWLWLCRCDCGKEKPIRGGDLRSGKSRSCGCYQGFRTHGFSRQLIYYVWRGMRSRCYDEKHNGFRYYGLCGISVCDEWKDNPETFCNWALETGYKKGLTLERINGKEDYSPSNCKWIEHAEQVKNMKSNHNFFVFGQTYTLTDVSKMFGIAPTTATGRIKRGWSSACVFLLPRFLPFSVEKGNRISGFAKDKKRLNAFKY